nr:AAA family ATPase [Polyangium spumosum]
MERARISNEADVRRAGRGEGAVGAGRVRGELAGRGGREGGVGEGGVQTPEAQHHDTTVRIERLAVENFRCFERTSLSFQAGLAVLIGKNGAGKTTLLDAIATALAGWLVNLSHDERGFVMGSAIVGSAIVGSAPLGWSLSPSDVRVARIDKAGITTFEPQFPARIQAELRLSGELFGSGVERTPPGSVGWKVDSSLVDSATVMREAVQNGLDVTLPLVAYYGTDRTWRSGQEPSAKRDDLSRLAGYAGCLEPTTDLSSVRSWFRRMELLALQDGRTPPVLEASRRAILACLDGFDLVRYDARLDDLAARSTTTGLFLAFAQLSAGQKNLLGMVADMAFRAATLNPHLGADAAEQTPGIVLIDEIELHLHPAWQRRVIPDLRRAFPKVQFIITTHSPQVLSEVPTESVIVLDDSQAYHPAAPTEGRDSNSILFEVLGVSPHPKETVAELEAIAHLIDDGNDAEARKRLDALAERLTERDPEVSRLRGILDVVERIDAGDHEGA